MKVRNVTVRISRHAGVEIEKSVPAWEVRVLNTIFGDAEVTQVGSEEVELLNEQGKPIDFNARDQYEVLVRRYGTATDSEGDKLLTKAYRDAYELESAFNRMKQAWEQDTPPPPKKVGRPARAVVIP
jgi:hypothetical protein